MSDYFEIVRERQRKQKLKEFEEFLDLLSDDPRVAKLIELFESSE
jgi:hypothetical protein